MNITYLQRIVKKGKGSISCGLKQWLTVQQSPKSVESALLPSECHIQSVVYITPYLLLYPYAIVWYVGNRIYCTGIHCSRGIGLLLEKYEKQLKGKDAKRRQG